MAELFTIDNLFTLLMLVVLQAVLGFDNLLYISLESKNAPEEKRAFVRKIGIGLAIVLRVGLLFLIQAIIPYLQEAFLHLNIAGFIVAEISGESLIILFGGGFILYTAIKEIWHMISLGEGEDQKEKKSKSINQVIFMIVFMNVVFSFDSILSAKALSDSTAVMAIAIVISGLMMIYLSGTVSRFLQKNRMYEVLGLFILFIVGVMLLTEGGHKAHLVIDGTHVEKMPSTTFYFIITVLVLVDVVQGRYQKKLMKQQAKQA